MPFLKPSFPHWLIRVNLWASVVNAPAIWSTLPCGHHVCTVHHVRRCITFHRMVPLRYSFLMIFASAWIVHSLLHCSLRLKAMSIAHAYSELVAQEEFDPSCGKSGHQVSMMGWPSCLDFQGWHIIICQMQSCLQLCWWSSLVLTFVLSGFNIWISCSCIQNLHALSTTLNWWYSHLLGQMESLILFVLTAIIIPHLRGRRLYLVVLDLGKMEGRGQAKAVEECLVLYVHILHVGILWFSRGCVHALNVMAHWSLTQ